MSGLLGKLRENGKATTARIALWYTIANVFAKGMAVISTPVFTRLLSKVEYGQFSNFTSWESILLVLVTVDFTASIARAKYDFDDRMDEYMSTILLFGNVVTLAAYLVIELNQGFFVNLFSMDIFYIRILFVYLLFSPAYSYLQAKHRIYRKYKFFVAFSMMSAIVRTGVSVLLVVLLQDKFLGRVCGYIIPITIFNVVLWVIVVSKGRKIDKGCLKFACMISIPLIPHALSGILLGNSDRIMITKFCGAEQTALYSLAYQISLLANLIWTSMNQAWAPWLFDNIHENNKNAIRKKSKLYLGVFAVLIIGVLLITPEIILILGGKQYYEARFVMPPVILGCVFQFVYGMYVNLEIYDKKTITISVGTISAALLNIGLNWLFIPIFGYIAAAYTTLVGYVALFFFHYLIVRKMSPQLSDLYEKKFLFLTIICLCVGSVFALVLYRLPVIRYVLIIIYGTGMLIGCYKFRNVIKKLLGMKGKT